MRRSGLSRERARAETYARVEEVLRLWRAETQSKGGKPAKREKRCPDAGSTTRGGRTEEKPTKGGTVSRSRKAVTKPVDATRREEKHNTRRTRAAVAARAESPETEGVVTRSPRRAAGASLRDDADSESEEFEWPSSEEDSDEEWTEQ
ncbi:hypothetical protein DL769_010432 [Monosporascus sp. CRB-8-3]|nr:hypothetical protein DL769_010432 [Monosporascus sp. CRB-8-3]